ncbi:hypothetical protein NAT51_13995 [Flavobacterium amniphilum]|uniref:hypothetical protein n=1 Tax=Flavobacterium amniphilum TaxID=1834035 RepID=UPI00202A06A2|nr:hypothetical protein [Flavobacterium amniphilum]MCL9806643.1 hypothetical protein [Flavobacterium amniphilum]
MPKFKTETIILIILWINVAFSLAVNPYVSPQFKIGMAGLTIATLCFWKLPKYGSHFLMLLLLFSLFEHITFSTINFHTGIKSSNIDLQINILSLILLLILVYKRREMIRKWYYHTGKNEKEESDAKLMFFKKGFQNLSERELEMKLENEILTDEAKTAVTELLEERRMNSTQHSNNIN